MIEQLLPSGVVTVETDRPLLDTQLYPAEESSVERAVEKRRREFLTGRACARRALEKLGYGSLPVPSGTRGEPLWPDGVVGSITHCRGYCACAATRVDGIVSVGIDAEVDERLPEGVLEAIASRRERERLSDHGAVAIDKVLFSAKEAVYKAWFPLTGRSLGFEDVDMTLKPNDATFCARLLVAGPVVASQQLTEFHGRWRVEGGVVMTAVVVAG